MFKEFSWILLVKSDNNHIYQLYNIIIIIADYILLRLKLVWEWNLVGFGLVFYQDQVEVLFIIIIIIIM